MNSLSFRERFKDKLGVILKNGTFIIHESSAIIKTEIPKRKFHPILNSNSIDTIKFTRTIDLKQSTNYSVPVSTKNDAINPKTVKICKSSSVLNNPQSVEQILKPIRPMQRGNSDCKLPLIRQNYRLYTHISNKLNPLKHFLHINSNRS